MGSSTFCMQPPTASATFGKLCCRALTRLAAQQVGSSGPKAVSGSHCVNLNAFHLGARLPAFWRQGIPEDCQQRHVYLHVGFPSGTCIFEDLIIMGYAEQK